MSQSDKGTGLETGFAIVERLAISPDHYPAGCAHNRVPRRDIPFHGGTKTGIDIGQPLRNKTKFER